MKTLAQDVIEKLAPFEIDNDGVRRSLGQQVVAWWVGNWASVAKIYTDEQLVGLADMLDNMFDSVVVELTTQKKD